VAIFSEHERRIARVVVAKVVLRGELLRLHVNSYFKCNVQFDIPVVRGGSCVGWASNADISKERSAVGFGVKQSNKMHFICVIFDTSIVC
jgi:hypothetical protein